MVVNMQRTFSYDGENRHSAQPSAVGTSPLVTGIVDFNNSQRSCDYSINSACTITATQLDTLSIYGQGFSQTGGNTVAVTINSITVSLYNGDGYYYWDGNGYRTLINAQLGCFVPPGTGTFQVYNPHSQIPSLSYNIVVVHSNSCP